MPNPYSYPLQPQLTGGIEHLAPASVPAPPQQLKKQMSKVWSRCLSINRKTHPPHPPIQPTSTDEEDFEGVLRSGSERRVFIERGYEVVPKITSTHLAKSQGGFREVDQVSQISVSDMSLYLGQEIQFPIITHLDPTTILLPSTI
jgi:hypothetical protein